MLCVLALGCKDAKEGTGDDESSTGSGATQGEDADDGADGDTGSDGGGSTGGGGATGDDGATGGGSTGDDGSSDGGTTGDGGSSDTGGGIGDCTRNDWVPVLEEGTLWSADGYLQYYSENAPDYPTDEFYAEWFLDFGASNQPGTHTFTDSNYASCHTCVVIYAGCDDAGSCDKEFLAIAGTMETTAIGGVGERIAATIRDVKLVEVLIDEDTFFSEKVEGGEVWCIDDYAFDVEILSP